MNWLTELHIPDFSQPSIWVSLLTLIFLEIVLGVDNIIFISIISNKLPENQQKRARNIGLLFAMVFRVALLLMINWIIGLKETVVELSFLAPINNDEPLGLSWKDIILLAGGLFLIVKSTLEINSKMREVGEAHHESTAKKVANNIIGIILQIIVIDLVFSLDSILTAVGLVDDVLIMIIAVIIAIGAMMLFAGAISRVINKHPSLQMLALSFLVVIGVLLVAEGIHQHISKSIIYSCLAFSLTVEMLNIRLRGKQQKSKKIFDEKDIENIES
ncbi:TerC family protein [Polluticaenibacter yanchengensis]|uniref:TerC family protein n=1 Tax=Polluticaenibacter yanchengensis TaxID=3014562 RepID=A0ABT4UJK1_9BACT|nr:TerC family protein [Chitinophagaceae bacterium LY-5]